MNVGRENFVLRSLFGDFPVHPRERFKSHLLHKAVGRLCEYEVLNNNGRSIVFGFLRRAVLGYYERSSRIFILFSDFEHLFFDYVKLKLSVAYNGGEFRYKLFKLFKLFFELIGFELGKPCESQVEYRLRLNFGKSERRHKVLLRRRRVFGSFDYLYNLVYVLYGNYKPF